MDIKIYEDQTGQMLYPEKRSDRDKGIVRLFDNKIDLYINKIDDKLEISCYLLAHKSLERAIGCYIVYTDFYSGKYFTNFKTESNKIIQNLGFRPHDDSENAIFDNIEKFDRGTYNKKDIDIIFKTINSGECLYYKGGNTSEISSFCKEILGNAKNIKIAISTRESNLGEINILRDKTYDVNLCPTTKTLESFDMQREKITISLAEDKKKKEGEVGKNKIIEGFRLIEDGVKVLVSAGFAKKDINDIIIGYINKIFSGILTERVNLQVEDNNKNKQNRGSKKGYFLIGLSMLLLGLVIGTYGLPYYKSEISPPKTPPPVIITDTPNVTASPGVITPEATTPEIPLIVETTPANVSNNTSINESNKTKATIPPIPYPKTPAATPLTPVPTINVTPTSTPTSTSNVLTPTTT